MIDLKELTISYGQKTITYPEIQVSPGEAVGLFGQSGCGKTSLLNALCEPDFSGKLRYRQARLMGRDLQVWGWERFAHMSYLPQFAQSALNPKMTLQAQMKLVLSSNQRPWEEDRLRRLLEQLKLDWTLLDRYPGTLSGGQRQRMVLVLNLIKGPKLLILDEPSSALDLMTLQEMVECLLQIKGHTTLLLVAHQRAFLEKVVDRVIQL